MSNKADAIDSSAVWQENRDEIFLKRFAADVARLIDAGIPPNIVRKVVCQYEYVKVWAACPRWLWPVKKLPKGHKWSDGEKTHFKKAGRRGSARTIILLSIGDDLYIRDKSLGIAGTRDEEVKGLCVRDFRKYLGKDIAAEFDRDLGGLILALYKKQGLPFGYAPPMDEERVFGNAHPDHKRPAYDKRLDVGFRVLKVVDADEPDEEQEEPIRMNATVTLTHEQCGVAILALETLKTTVNEGIVNAKLGACLAPTHEETAAMNEGVDAMKKFAASVDEIVSAITLAMGAAT